MIYLIWLLLKYENCDLVFCASANNFNYMETLVIYKILVNMKFAQNGSTPTFFEKSNKVTLIMIYYFYLFHLNLVCYKIMVYSRNYVNQLSHLTGIMLIFQNKLVLFFHFTKIAKVNK